MEWISNAVTALLAVSALFIVGSRVRDHFRPGPQDPVTIENAERFAAEGHLMGPPDAPVRIVEFADYQCPYCQRSEPVLKAIRERYPQEVAIVYRHVPLAIHDSALAAARAAECADQQAAFEEFHHFVFANAKSIGVKPWAWFAGNADLADISAFEACLRDEVEFPSIDRDQAAATELGIDATPTFLINDRMFVRFMTLAEMDREVQRALGKARRRASR